MFSRRSLLQRAAAAATAAVALSLAGPLEAVARLVPPRAAPRGLYVPLSGTFRAGVTYRVGITTRKRDGHVDMHVLEATAG